MDKKQTIINKYYKIRKQESKTCKSKSYNYFVADGDIRISVLDIYDNVRSELLNNGFKSIAMTTLTRSIPDRTNHNFDTEVPIIETSDVIENNENAEPKKKVRKPRSDKGKTRIPAPNLLKLKCI